MENFDLRLDINSMCIVINQFIVTPLFVSRSYGKKYLPFYGSDSVPRVCNVDFIYFSGSKAHMEMERIIRGRLLITDVKKLSSVQQTSELEAFHKLVCHFSPRLVHFFHAKMEARYFTTYYHYLHPFQFSLYTVDTLYHSAVLLCALGAAVAEWLSSWLAEQDDWGSIPGLATWFFRDWLSPASKSRYG